MKSSRELYKKLMLKYKNEMVYVVPYDMVKQIPDEFYTDISNYEKNNIWTHFDSMGKYIYRYDAEYNNAIQQVIPYVVIKDSKGRYFTGKRLKGDSRLTNQYSIGWGGHINPADGSNEILLHALSRELSEELDLKITSKANFIGYIRDLKSKTKEHIGCIFSINASDCSVLETDKLEGKWETINDLEKIYPYCENWSKYIINYILQLHLKHPTLNK